MKQSKSKRQRLVGEEIFPQNLADRLGVFRVIGIDIHYIWIQENCTKSVFKPERERRIFDLSSEASGLAETGMAGLKKDRTEAGMKKKA